MDTQNEAPDGANSRADPNYPDSVVVEFRRGRGRSRTEHEITVEIEWIENGDGKRRGQVCVPASSITLTKLYLGLTQRFGTRVVSPRTEDGVHKMEINPVKVYGALPPAPIDEVGTEGVPEVVESVS